MENFTKRKCDDARNTSVSISIKILFLQKSRNIYSGQDVREISESKVYLK